jgi:hypothetical protein
MSVEQKKAPCRRRFYRFLEGTQRVAANPDPTIFLYSPACAEANIRGNYLLLNIS